LAKQTVIAAGGDVSLPGERPVNRRHLLSCAFIVMGVYCLLTVLAVLCFYLQAFVRSASGEDTISVLEPNLLIYASANIGPRAIIGLLLICLSERLGRLLVGDGRKSEQALRAEWEEAALQVGLAIVGFLLLLGAANRLSQGILNLTVEVPEERVLQVRQRAWAWLLGGGIRGTIGLYCFVGAPGLRRRLLGKPPSAGARRGAAGVDKRAGEEVLESGPPRDLTERELE